MPGPLSQSTNAVLMVRPAAFGPNPETAESNAFQRDVNDELAADIQSAAVDEFNRFVQVLREAGIRVLVAHDDPTPPKPDAIFPNNWLSFHEEGRAALYPMFSAARRAERNMEVLDAVRQKFELYEAVDYTDQEKFGRYLEGTGSMVLDRIERVAYACHSERTNPEVLATFCDDFGYESVQFGAFDAYSVPIYHTNVMMCLGTRFATICLDSISDLGQRTIVRERILASGREIVEITVEQMGCFAGNMLELQDSRGEKKIVMSTHAYYSLTANQVTELNRFGQIVSSDLDTIEKYGGGSARCMICEVFLTPKP